MGYSSPWLDWLSNNTNKEFKYTVYELGSITIHVGRGAFLENNEMIYIDGQLIPNPPCEFNNLRIINRKVYVDGYEYKDGIWKKTLAAWWYKYF